MASEERLFGIWNELYGLDPDQELKTVAAISDDSFAGYGSLIVQVLLHPAIAGDAIYVRLGNNLVKLGLQ